MITDILLSGGAIGADTLFSQCAYKAGHLVKNYSFEGHHIPKIVCGDVVILSEQKLMEADPFLQRANQVLKRKIRIANNFYVMNLLRRNYYQIKETERIYAVAPLLENGIVGGGTGWTVQMAIDQRVPEVYLYDLLDNIWIKCNHATLGYKKWETVWQPPKPHGVYTGIGSREITKEGEEAIRKLYA